MVYISLFIFNEQLPLLFKYIIMPGIVYRQAIKDDIPLLAALRSDDLGNQVYWKERIAGYMEGTHHPQQALLPRIVLVACEDEKIIGFIAGHLTRRYQCDGELEWIDVTTAYRRKGIATALVKLLATWFIEQQAYKICIDPGNAAARKFYNANGAAALNDHWMFWDDIRMVMKK